MASSKGIIVVLIAVTIGAVLFLPIMDVVNENTGEVTVEDESLTAEIDTPQDLDGYAVIDGTETVEYSTDDGDSWTEAMSSDYSLDTESGEITFTSDGNVSEGDQVRVGYDYEATDSTTTTVVGIVPLFIALLLLVALARKVTEGLE